MPELSLHAQDQMTNRGITDEDVRLALSHRSGPPRPGSNGALIQFGFARGGRILKIVLTPDREKIITLAWPDE